MHYKTAVNTNGHFLGVFIKTSLPRETRHTEKYARLSGALTSFSFLILNVYVWLLAYSRKQTLS